MRRGNWEGRLLGRCAVGRRRTHVLHWCRVIGRGRQSSRTWGRRLSPTLHMRWNGRRRPGSGADSGILCNLRLEVAPRCEGEPFAACKNGGLRGRSGRVWEDASRRRCHFRRSKCIEWERRGRLGKGGREAAEGICEVKGIQDGCRVGIEVEDRAPHRRERLGGQRDGIRLR